MTDRSALHTDSGSARTDSDVEALTLDRRRDKLRAARSAAAATATAVTALDSELASNAGQRRNYVAGLQAARDHVAALKTTMKASRTERDELRGARKDAGRRAANAAQRASAAEVKYDRAVLADLLRREKANDLAANDMSAHPHHTGAANGDGPRQSATTTRPRSETKRGRTFS